MSQALSIAHARGWNLATRLMVCIMRIPTKAATYSNLIAATLPT